MPRPFGGTNAEAGPSTSASTPHSRSASPGPATQQLRRPASHSRLAQLMAPGRSRSSSTVSQEASPVTAYADDSVTGGRTTPEQRRRTARAAASLLASDGRYKKFVAQVDKSLQSFENVNEWADFISFLSRLLKTLQGPSPPYTEIPRKVIVAKRLAQCLNPALPAGVHTRALDVYNHIFGMIGTDGLRRDLLIWSSGLFPFFQSASTSVRPALIHIYETYYLPLGEDLRSAAKALILALLPGVEEETGDFFDQVMSLLNRLSDAVSSRFFLQNVFLVLISSPSSRLAGLNYLARRLSDPPDDVDSGLWTRGIAAVLGDNNMLVRRGGLDLLLKVLPLNGPIFRQASLDDQHHLVRAVSSVVLQRDVSLSRRVYTWFLGVDETEQQSYFKQHGLQLLSDTLRTDMDKLSLRDDQTPFKVFLSLLDKWELGDSLSQSLAISSLLAISKASGDFQGTATAVYEAMEPSVVWGKLREGVELDATRGGLQHVDLARWVLATIPQHDSETVNIHVPLFLQRVLALCHEKLDAKVLDGLLALAMALLQVIPNSAFVATIPNGHESNRSEEAQAAQQVRDDILPEIVRSIFMISQAALMRKWPPAAVLSVAQLCKILIEREVPSLSHVDSASWITAVMASLETVHSFAVVDVLVDSTLMASRSNLFSPPVDPTSDSILYPVLNTLFRYLRPEVAAYHARAVELLWEYNQLADIHILETVIARRMSSPLNKLEAIEAFGVLWRQSDDSMLPGEIFHVPMCMVLDSLKSEDPQELRTAETWMRCNLKSYFRMLDPLLRRMLDLLGRQDEEAQMCYLVSSSTSLFRFGGQGLSKACHSSEVRKSTNAMFVARAEEFPNANTYLDLLTEVLMKLLSQTSLRVQSAALELLQLLVTRGDLTPASVGQIKQSLITELSIATKSRRLTLQNTMLHLLHSAISARVDRRRHRVTSSTFSIPEKSSMDVTDFDDSLAQAIITGVSAPGNRPILQHWVDFVLMTIPHFEHNSSLLRALCDCFCEQLRMAMLKLRCTFDIDSVADVPASFTEAEPIMLIGVIERLATVLGVKLGARKSDDKDKHHEGSGLLGYLPTVFSVEAPQDPASRVEACRYLDDVMDSLLVTWTVTEDSQSTSSTHASEVQIMSATRSRASRALEKLFKPQASEVVASCVQVWANKSSDVEDSAIFDCLDTLAPSAQRVVDLVCEHMGGKGRGSIESSNPALPAFLEAYISRLEGPIAVQVWNAQYGYARDILGQSSSAAKMLLFPILRCLTMMGQIVSTTSALEDRRLRRDLQETYVKLLDSVLSGSSRLGESATWERGAKLPLEDEKGSHRGIHKIYSYIGDSVLHNLRTFLVENDRVASACASVASHIIAPAFKQQKTVDPTILKLLQEMSKIPVAVKAWRTPVGDAFNDNRFFRMKPEEAAMWRPLLSALMDSDKERLGELLGRITAAPSANIFTNREQETISRSLNLRRLSFVLLAAERNHHLAQLPSIQEKLVEILRTNIVSPRVHSEVYLCLRVLMCRISPQHLSNFWPVILAELLRVFESTMDDPPEDGSEDLALVLAACKFLDLLLVIQSEDFQIHQWIFITDTTDAAYPPEDYNPEALIDRLADILAEHAGATKSVANAVDIQTDAERPRRPHLSGLKSLSSLHQLQPFFSRASIDTFEGVYNDAGVDWEAIEEGLYAEIFEGE